MTKEDINSRTVQAINRLLETTTGLTKSALADSFAIKPAKFSEILNGRMCAGTDIMGVLCSKYGVSSKWLLTGSGNMQSTSETEISAIEKDTQLSVGIALHDEHGIPLIPIEAVAGVLSGDDVSVMDYECEHYTIPMFKGAEFLIQVKGDSMQPKYYSGDIVACKRLPLDTFFQWNRVYVVDTEQGVLIKRVRAAADTKHITLVSENSDYAPFKISRKQIYSLALVLGVVRAE